MALGESRPPALAVSYLGLLLKISQLRPRRLLTWKSQGSTTKVHKSLTLEKTDIEEGSLHAPAHCCLWGLFEGHQLAFFFFSY